MLHKIAVLFTILGIITATTLLGMTGVSLSAAPFLCGSLGVLTFQLMVTIAATKVEKSSWNTFGCAFLLFVNTTIVVLLTSINPTILTISLGVVSLGFVTFAGILFGFNNKEKVNNLIHR